MGADRNMSSFHQGTTENFLPIYSLKVIMRFFSSLAILPQLSTYSDPRTFSLKPGPLGQVHAWGLYHVCAAFGFIRKITHGNVDYIVFL